MINSAANRVLALCCLTAVLSGCGGVGVILFKKENGGPIGAKNVTSQVFDLDCSDSFQATGGQTALGGQAGITSVGCSYQGAPMAWNKLGYFHCAPMAAGNWEKYREKVIAQASKRGCPGVAIRKLPPSVNQQGEAIGAWCVAL